jgi:GNAT superfamily N-acetyltransferase
VPSHYDLFAVNGEDPAAFEMHMDMAGMGGKAMVLDLLTPLLVADDGSVLRAQGKLAMEWDCAGEARPVDLPPGYKMRNYRDGDSVAIGEIYRNTLGSGFDEGWFKREILASPLFTPERIFVVEHGGRPVGCALAWEDDPRMGRRQGLLMNLSADPLHHRRGLGKALTAVVQLYFRKQGRRSVMLAIGDHRLRGIRSYLSVGFKPVESDPAMARRWGNVREAIDRLVE